MEIKIGSHTVKGVALDAQSRCTHWHSKVDIVALRVPGDPAYYACYECYEQLHHKLPPVWTKDNFEQEEAILCGNCGHAMSIKAYLSSKNVCPNCKHPFNPGCAKHYQYYFES